MSVALLATSQALRDTLSGLEPALYSGADASRLTEDLSLTKKVLEGALARMASRAAECGAHREAGFSRPSDWLAKHAGTLPGQARRDLETASALDDHPATKAALARGDVSMAEAEEVVKTEEASPGTEDEMLDLVKRRGLSAAKETGRRIRQGAVDIEELDRKRREARGVKTWTDELGMVCFFARLLPEVGVRFLSRLEAEAERDWRAGNRESTPEQRARDIAKRALITVVLHDGKKIDSDKRYGPHIPAELLALLEIGDPPRLRRARVCGLRIPVPTRDRPCGSEGQRRGHHFRQPQPQVPALSQGQNRGRPGAWPPGPEAGGAGSPLTDPR